jgi:hypothetical protein
MPAVDIYPGACQNTVALREENATLVVLSSENRFGTYLDRVISIGHDGMVKVA